MRQRNCERLGQCAGKVVKQLAQLRAERIRIAKRAFASIRRYDPVTAKLAEHVLGGHAEAAYWFAAPHFLGETSLWNVIAFGDVAKIRTVLAGYKKRRNPRNPASTKRRTHRGEL